MSWWYPQLNALGEIVSGNGDIWLNGRPIGGAGRGGHSPQWMDLHAPGEVLIDGDLQGGRIVHTSSGRLVRQLGFEFNARVGNTSGICAGANQWCGWNNAQGLVYNGTIIDREAAPGAIDAFSGALYYLTPYQSNRRNVIIDGQVLHTGLVTEIVAGEDCATWGEYVGRVRTLTGWSREQGVMRLSPLPDTEYVYTGVPVRTPTQALWVVALTHKGLIIFPWGQTRGYIVEGEFYYHHALWVDGVLKVVATDGAGALRSFSLTLTEPRQNLADYRPSTGGGVPPDPEPPDPQPPDPEDEMKPPVVTVDRWNLDDVLEGREFVFHDGGNPDLQIACRVWVQGGSMYAQMSNKAGTAQTGVTRTVKPCSEGSSGPEPPEPEPGPDPQPPEPTDKFTLKRHDSSRFLSVGSDRFLAQSSYPAVFQLAEQTDGTVGLRANGSFVAAETDHRLKADRGEVGDWERFTLEVLDSEKKTVAFKSWEHLYISAHDDGAVAADMPEVGGWETLVMGAVSGERPPVAGKLRADGRIFRNAAGEPWRYKGVSAFPLHRRFADGTDIAPFLDAFPGYNMLRLFAYVTWPGTGWEMPSVDQFMAFLDFVKARGWYVELCLLTDDDPGRLNPAKQLVRDLSARGPENLVLEIGNEPTTHKNINTAELRSVCEASGFLFSSGDYEDSSRHFGTFLTAHTPRDSEWPRKGHDLMEYYGGGGPSKPSDPAHHCPCVGDEPIRPDQCDPNWWPTDQDYLAYGGVCALLGAGATFHSEVGKLITLPTDLERRCAQALLAGLSAFPADAPNWGYERIDEQGGSLRTYLLGGSCMVRVRPTTPACPRDGFTPLDSYGILWRKP